MDGRRRETEGGREEGREAAGGMEGARKRGMEGMQSAAFKMVICRLSDHIA